MYLDYLKQKIRQGGGQKVCIFPMGIAGKSMLSKLHSVGIEIDFFCDNNPQLWGTTYCGKRCISKNELIEQAENTLVIVESLYYKEIKEVLLADDICNIERVFFEKIAAEKYIIEHPDIKESIEAVKEICADERSRQIIDYIADSWFSQSICDDYFEKIYENNQYFDEKIISLSNQEIFVDLGAYTGDTAEAFLKNCHGNYEKMHLFELDPTIYKRLQDNIPRLQALGNGIIQCYPYGASDKNQTIHFRGGDSNSTIETETQDVELECGKVVTLDKILDGEKVTFIKMDIEGAEQPALRGAENVIKTMHPKLAVCIYHSVDDMLKIPIWIKSIVPEYKIYIRHYTDEMLETVCYAIAEND